MKPLNIWSKSDEEIGKLMSNFAHTPFVLDGILYSSIEGFYASLLIQGNPAKQAKVRQMWGIRAKHEIPKNKPQVIHYNGENFTLGSKEHIRLIKRAIQAKLEAHPEIATAFVFTRPRPIAHETGYADAPDAEFPKEVFCKLLEKVREEFANRIEKASGQDRKDGEQKTKQA
jgi:Bacteriophage protein GP30.3